MKHFNIKMLKKERKKHTHTYYKKIADLILLSLFLRTNEREGVGVRGMGGLV